MSPSLLRHHQQVSVQPIYESLGVVCRLSHAKTLLVELPRFWEVLILPDVWRPGDIEQLVRLVVPPITLSCIWVASAGRRSTEQVDMLPVVASDGFNVVVEFDRDRLFTDGMVDRRNQKLGRRR